MDGSRIQRPAAATQRVQPTRDGANKRKDEEAPQFQLEDDEARMAATSQAHDEARHYYVMRDYLNLLGEVPTEIDPQSSQIFTLDL